MHNNVGAGRLFRPASRRYRPPVALRNNTGIDSTLGSAIPLPPLPPPPRHHHIAGTAGHRDHSGLAPAAPPRNAVTGAFQPPAAPVTTSRRRPGVTGLLPGWPVHRLAQRAGRPGARAHRSAGTFGLRQQSPIGPRHAIRTNSALPSIFPGSRAGFRLHRFFALVITSFWAAGRPAGAYCIDNRHSARRFHTPALLLHRCRAAPRSGPILHDYFAFQSLPLFSFQSLIATFYASLRYCCCYQLSLLQAAFAIAINMRAFSRPLPSHGFIGHRPGGSSAGRHGIGQAGQRRYINI